jgi:hypothetical protein
MAFYRPQLHHYNQKAKSSIHYVIIEDKNLGAYDEKIKLQKSDFY